MNNAFFAIGLAFLAVGIATVATGNGIVWSTFLALGVVFLALASGVDRDDAEDADAGSSTADVADGGER